MHLSRRSCLLVLAALVVGCAVDGSSGAPSAPSSTPVDAAVGTVPATQGTAGPTPAPTTSPGATPTAPPVPSPTAVPSPLPPLELGDLPRDLRRAVAAGPEGASPGVVVLAPDGRDVFAHEGDEPLLPASTAKVLTAAAALEVLGPTARLTTRVEAVGPVDADGVLRGHLRLVGDGDPTLSTDAYRRYVYASRPASAVEDLATQVAAAGITRATAGVVTAPDPLGPDRVAPGWREEYLTYLDARRITGLTVDAGLKVTVVEEPPQLQLELLGEQDPTARLVRALRLALADNGVRPGVPGAATGLLEGEVVGVVHSEPMTELLRFTLERSDNQLADSLLRLVGAELGDPSFVGAGRGVGGVLAELGAPVDGLRLVDGSGLSRRDRVTARTLAAVDRIQRSGTLGATWRDLGAEVGTEGTLAGRLRDSVAAGRFVGKTGTLRDTVGLVGTVEGPDGAPAFHLAVLHNGLTGAGQRSAARRVEDELVALLAEHAAGCRRVPAPAATPTATPSDGTPAPQPTPQVRVVCPAAP